jgi:chorismate lyase/3-hydroxybenzoate synthase
MTPTHAAQTTREDDPVHGPLAVRAWAPPDDPGHLAAIATAMGAAKLPHAAALPLPWLGGTSRVEFWRTQRAPRRDESPGLSLAWTEDVLFGALVVEDTPTGAMRAAERGYRAMTDACARFGFPHLLRVWNWMGAINDGEGDRERYRQFCVGRARVIPSEPATGYAAATAIGIAGAASSLHLHFLAARRPGVPVENPRQVSAWEYPREYGPVAPGFSRAMLLDWCQPPLLLISGTASVVGHASAHDDTLAQLDETLANIEALVARAAQRVGGGDTVLGARSLLRVYLRDAADAAAVSARLLQRLGAQVPFMLLHGDICRRELKVEIEAVHALG